MSLISNKLRSRTDRLLNENNLNVGDSLPQNALYLMTNSSCEKTKIHRVKVPLTRNPVMDFNMTYLTPKMWPSNKSRLKNERASMIPIINNNLKLANYNTSRSLNRTQNKEPSNGRKLLSEYKESTTPLIFVDKPDFSSNESRRFNLNKPSINSDEKLSERMTNQLTSKSSNLKTALWKCRSELRINESKSQTPYVYNKNQAQSEMGNSSLNNIDK